jgi:hypothetical protein
LREVLCVSPARREEDDAENVVLMQDESPPWRRPEAPVHSASIADADRRQMEALAGVRSPGRRMAPPEKPQEKWIVLGVTLTLFGAVIAGLALTLEWPGTVWGTVGSVLLVLVVIAVPVGAGFYVWERARFRSRKRRNLCLYCGHPRHGLSDDTVCPECGAPRRYGW